MEQNTPQPQLLMSPEKSVPKFCTGTRINKLDNSDLIMKIFTDMDNEFSEMSKILKSRNRAPWRK